MFKFLLFLLDSFLKKIVKYLLLIFFLRALLDEVTKKLEKLEELY